MKLKMGSVPKRIVCLTEEPTEILYLLGEDEKIVGISTYTVRPKKAQREKPVVSAFIGGSVKKIAALKPDLIIGFSDIQANLAKELIEAHLPVLIFNQRTLQEILDVITTVGHLVGRQERAQELVDGYIQTLCAARAKTEGQKYRPKVYFEEWDDPQISAIKWVSELIELAGGEDVFSHKSDGRAAKERFVSMEELRDKSPEIMIASWCGKPLDKDSVKARVLADEIPAIAEDKIYEMDPSIILQPGPACLTDGLRALEEIIRKDG